MTDYELATIYTDIGTNLFTLFTIYYSVIFAFVIASHFVAHELPRTMSVLVVCLYFVTMALAAYQQSVLVFTFIELGIKIKEEALIPGSDLEWHMAKTVPDVLARIIPWLFTSANAFVYVGGIYYFILCRRGQLGAAAQPK